MRRTPVTAVLLFALSAATVAEGGEPPWESRTAETLFLSAREAMERGDLATACPQFVESQRLDPAVGTLLNLGECEARSGKLASALRRFQSAGVQLEASDLRMPFVEQRIADLSRRAPRVLVTLVGLRVPGYSVRCDDTELASAALDTELPFDPGPHTYVVHAPGRVESRVEVTLKEGERRTIALPMGAPTASPSPQRDTPSRAPHLGNTQRVAGLIAGGAGIAALGVGAVLGVVAKRTYDDALANCPRGLSGCTETGVAGVKSAHAQAAGSTAAFVAAAVLLVGGGTIYFTAPKAGPVSVTPAFLPAGAGLLARAVW